MTSRGKPRASERRPAARLNLTARQVALLGTMSDPDAALEIGTTAYAIRTERRARGIAPFRTGGEREGAGRPPAAGVKQTERLGLTMTEPEMAEIVAAVPEGATLGRWVVEAALMRARTQEARQASVEVEDRIAVGHEVLDCTPSDPPTVRAVVATLLATTEPPGREREGCPGAGSELPADRKFIPGRRDAAG